MDLGLQDRRVLVTGGSSGIGEATAVAFGNEGAKVAITYHRNDARAKATAARVEEAGGEAMTLAMDLGDDDSIRSAVEEVAAHWGGIDILVNNAVEWTEAQQWPPDFAQMDPAQWRRMLRTSLEGVFSVVQAAIPALRDSDMARVIFLSSGTAEYGLPGEEAYAAAKSGLHGLSRCLARELGRQGVLVNVVMPGLTSTERCMTFIPEAIRQAVAQQTATGRLSSPEDVADTILFLASGRNGNITGEVVRVNGGA